MLVRPPAPHFLVENACEGSVFSTYLTTPTPGHFPSATSWPPLTSRRWEHWFSLRCMYSIVCALCCLTFFVRASVALPLYAWIFCRRTNSWNPYYVEPGANLPLLFCFISSTPIIVCARHSEVPIAVDGSSRLDGAFGAVAHTPPEFSYIRHAQLKLVTETGRVWASFLLYTQPQTWLQRWDN